MSWFEKYKGKPIGFIVENGRGDHFTAVIGVPLESEGDDDCYIRVLSKTSPQESLEETVNALRETSIDFQFLKPCRPGMAGFYWLWPILREELGRDPRRIHETIRD